MKLLKKISYSVIALSLIFVSSCSKDESPETTKTETSQEEEEPKTGTFRLYFDHKLGDSPVSIKEAGSKDYQYTDANNQEYNISLYGYYVSKIELIGSDGKNFTDPVSVGPNPEDVKGYYHVVSLTENSNSIDLKNVPEGKYNKVRFTIGIDEDGLSEGALGGILDPANGAWFWNWNAGYIGFGVNGNASNSGEPGNDKIEKGSFAIHTGGWKDIEPQDGEDPKFVNNVKVLELDFGTDAEVKFGVEAKAHIYVNFDKYLDNIDFSKTYSVHSPFASKPFAAKLKDVFKVDHVH